MKITWLFFPKGQESVKLEVILDPSVPNKHSGVLFINQNKAMVNYEVFNIFNKGTTFEKKCAFTKLIRVEFEDTLPNVFENMKLSDGREYRETMFIRQSINYPQAGIVANVS